MGFKHDTFSLVFTNVGWLFFIGLKPQAIKAIQQQILGQQYGVGPLGWQQAWLNILAAAARPGGDWEGLGSTGMLDETLMNSEVCRVSC